VRVHFPLLALLDGSTLEALRKKTQALRRVEGLALAGRMMVMVRWQENHPPAWTLVRDRVSSMKQEKPPRRKDEDTAVVVHTL
jgi:hypothetical protein